MEENSKALILLFVVTLPCLIGAYLIGVKQAMFLIAGWDESKISNKNAFATMFGWVLFVLAINAAAAAFLNYYNFIGEEGVVIIILASVGVLFATAIYGQIKFKVIKNSLS